MAIRIIWLELRKNNTVRISKCHLMKTNTLDIGKIYHTFKPKSTPSDSNVVSRYAAILTRPYNDN